MADYSPGPPTRPDARYETAPAPWSGAISDITATDEWSALAEHYGAVADLQAMTDILRSYRPGDVADLVYIRDGQRVTTKVTFGKRGG